MQLPHKLLIIPFELANRMRVFKLRCALADPASTSGSTNSAQETLLREHFLRLVWQFPKLQKLVHGALLSSEAYGCAERVYMALPSQERTSTAKPLQRIEAAEKFLNASSVDSAVADTADLEERVAKMEDFARGAREGHLAAQSTPAGSHAAGDQTFLDFSVGGGAPTNDSVANSLGMAASIVSGHVCVV